MKFCAFSPPPPRSRPPSLPAGCAAATRRRLACSRRTSRPPGAPWRTAAQSGRVGRAEGRSRTTTRRLASAGGRLESIRAMPRSTLTFRSRPFVLDENHPPYPFCSLRRGRAAEQRSHRSREDPRRTHGARPSEYTVTAHRGRAPWEVHLHPHRVVYRRTRAGRAYRRGDEHEYEEHGDSHTPSVTPPSNCAIRGRADPHSENYRCPRGAPRCHLETRLASLAVISAKCWSLGEPSVMYLSTHRIAAFSYFGDPRSA